MRVRHNTAVQHGCLPDYDVIGEVCWDDDLGLLPAVLALGVMNESKQLLRTEQLPVACCLLRNGDCVTFLDLACVLLCNKNTNSERPACK